MATSDPAPADDRDDPPVDSPVCARDDARVIAGVVCSTSVTYAAALVVTRDASLAEDVVDL